MMIRLKVFTLLCWLSLGCVNDLESSSVGVTTQEVKVTVRPLRIPSIDEDPEPLSKTNHKQLIPAQLPLPVFWKKGLGTQAVKHDMSEVVHRMRVNVKGPNTWRDITVIWSKYFSDAERREVIDALKLPKTPTTKNSRWTTLKNRKWRISQERDSTTTVLEWQKRPQKTSTPLPRCGRPHHLETPKDLPNQLSLRFRKMSTKRTIEIEHRLDTQTHEISMTVWYKNGFAQDEHIGQMQSQLSALKWQRSEGTSVKQSWTNDDDFSLNWYPVREAFPMGCTLRGPLIKFSWSQKR
jgi:hypothetical protein